VAQRYAPSARRGQFGKKAGASAFFHFLGKLPHRFLGDRAAFASGKGSLGIVNRQEEFRPLPFAG
jgi:hypothetical protein